jgi:hypothetical protein
MNRLWRVSVPIGLILAYRLIPRRIRMFWSMGSATGSRDAYAAVSSGGGWPAFRRYNRGWASVPGYVWRKFAPGTSVDDDWKFDWVHGSASIRNPVNWDN